MVLIINIIAAIILFWFPIKFYQGGRFKVVAHPLYPSKRIYINPELEFLVYSILTAMVFLGPLSLIKYAYWILFLITLSFSRLTIRVDSIVRCYLAFLLWALISAVFISTVKFQAFMLLIKYTLPLFYLWLGYSAVNDDDDLLYFMKCVAIGMCVYALLIGGFAAKFFGPLYGFLNFKSGGLFISYASLADYFSGLIVVPIGLYLVSKDKKWIFATLWIMLSTVLETVRTGLGGLCFASSFFLLTIYKLKAIPWIVGLCIVGVTIVFTVPAFRDKMFKDESVTISDFKIKDANFENINSNAREYLWDMNMTRFYDPSPIVGSGLGASVEYTKESSGLKLIHSDYVQILCDLGLIGIILFGIFVIATLYTIIRYSWMSDATYGLKLTGGMALGSCAGTFFSMAFDNVIAYCQQSFVLPFVFIGIFLRFLDKYKSELN